MKEQKKIIITFFIILNTCKFYSQDIIQSYEIPELYNSAYIGTEACSKVVPVSNYAHIRAGEYFLYNNLLVDLSIRDISGGLKLSILRASSPHEVFTRSKVTIGYAYNNNLTKKIRFSLSVQANFCRNAINYDKLVFPDMLSVYSNQIFPTTETFYSVKNNQINFGGGFLLYSEKFRISGFVDNFFSLELSEPGNDKLRYCFIGDYKLYNTKKTGKISYHTFFTYYYYYGILKNGFLYKKNKINIGLFEQLGFYSSLITNSIELYFACDISKLTIGYSYLFQIGLLSKLSNSVHEVSLKYKFMCQEKNKNNTIKCPIY